MSVPVRATSLDSRVWRHGVFLLTQRPGFDWNAPVGSLIILQRLCGVELEAETPSASLISQQTWSYARGKGGDKNNNSSFLRRQRTDRQTAIVCTPLSLSLSPACLSPELMTLVGGGAQYGGGGADDSTHLCVTETGFYLVHARHLYSPSPCSLSATRRCVPSSVPKVTWRWRWW